jgi:hypothetical protein
LSIDKPQQGFHPPSFLRITPWLPSLSWIVLSAGYTPFNTSMVSTHNERRRIIEIGNRRPLGGPLSPWIQVCFRASAFTRWRGWHSFFRLASASPRSFHTPNFAKDSLLKLLSFLYVTSVSIASTNGLFQRTIGSEQIRSVRNRLEDSGSRHCHTGV